MAGRRRSLLPAFFMEQPRTSLLQKLLPSWTVFTILAVVYLRTIAPGLTWANGGSDGGDLITAAATGGVAHPTGYPLYLLLARLFQLLPVGSLAFRTNLMSALAMALAGGLVCHLVLRARPYVNIYLLWIGGMAAGLAFGLAPLVWSQAVITEVYALQALLVVILFHLYGFPKSGSGAYDCLRGAFLGLALTAHLTSLVLLPALLMGSLHQQGNEEKGAGRAGSPLRRLRFDRAALLRQLAGMGAGLSLYGLLPLRSRWYRQAQRLDRCPVGLANNYSCRRPQGSRLLLESKAVVRLGWWRWRNWARN